MFGSPYRPAHPPQFVGGVADESAPTGSPTDTFICGECRFTTAELEKFVEHRKVPCSRKHARYEGEPQKFDCFTCGQQCDSSWALINHLSETHKLCMYKK
ncbi:hnrpc-prov protein [Aphelenchoides avenae]|nr:hnrpc-prov protein [Aphelenchus avenae]